jgi:hypothetical protein
MTNPWAPTSLPLVSVPINAELRKLGDPGPAGSCLFAKGTYHLTSSSLLHSRRCPLQSRLVTTAKRTGTGSLFSYDVVYNRLKKDSREWRARFKCLVSRVISMGRRNTARILRVPQHDSYLSAFPQNRFLPSASSTTPVRVLSRRSQLMGPSCCVFALRSAAFAVLDTAPSHY